MVDSNLQYAAALLNPYLLQDKELADDADAVTSCKTVLEKLCKPDDYAAVVKEFMAFRHRDPPFHNMKNPGEQMLSAHVWWDFEGACGKFIAPLAKRILAQPVSSSSCERNWSSYSFVHNKSRNKLKPERAADLVYVYSNSKVLNASKEKDEKKWYDDNVEILESEDSDRPTLEDDDEDDDDDLEKAFAIVNGEGELIHTTQSGDEDAMEDCYELRNDTSGDRNDNNVDIEGNENDLYAFPEDENNIGVEENLPPIATYCNGTSYMSSEKILSQKQVAFIGEVKLNEDAFDNDGTSEAVLNLKSPSVAVEMVEKPDKGSYKRGCEIEEMDMQKDVDQMKGDKGDAIVVECGKGKEPMKSNLEVSRSSGFPSISLKPSSKRLESSQTFGYGKRLMDISKRNSTRVDPCKVVSVPTTLSDMDSDQPLLGVLESQRSKKPIVGEPNKAPNNTLLLQKSVKVKIIVHGQPDQKSKLMNPNSNKGKMKRDMQPFAISPVKKTPLDEDVNAFSNRKKRKVPIQKAFHGSIKVKKEKLDSNERKKPSLKRGLKKTTTIDIDDMEDDSDNEDFERRARGETSGAEVKGDVDWHP